MSDTRQRLLDAGFAAIAEHGYAGASTVEIAERAGFTRGAFYHHFASKEALVVALQQQHTEHALATMRSALDDLPRDADADQVRTRLFEALGNALPDDRRRWHVVDTELTLHALRDPAAAEVVRAHRAAVRTEVEHLLSAVAARAGVAIRPEPSAAARLAMLVGGSALVDDLLDEDAGVPDHERTDLTALLWSLLFVD